MEIKNMPQTDYRKPPIGKGAAVIAVFLAIVFGIWYFSSGIIGKDAAQTSVKNTQQKSKKAAGPGTLELSYYNNWVKFIPGVNAKETYPEKEFIEIEVIQANVSNADATGWLLENSLGEKVPLGKASALPISGKVNETEALKLQGGDHLVVSTGRSPIGVSFHVNKCSPYLEQFQDFIPPLSDECPYVTYERNFGSLDGECQIFIQDIRPCETNTRPLPSHVAPSCKAFLDSTVNYNGCVATHKNDPDFYKKEWRIFLGKEKELWDKSDTITLLDKGGKLIDALKYR